VCCQSEVSILNNLKTSPACQQDGSIDILSSPICKHFGSNESLCHASANKRFNANAKNKLYTVLTNPLADVNVVDVNVVDGNDSFDDVRVTMKRSSTPFRLNDKNESTKINANVDDDVQEVLRIMRGNIRNDINHESPNRIEREILLQSATNEMCVFPMHCGSSFRKENRSAELTANDIETSDYSSFASIAEDSYQFLQDALSKKLSLCLKDLRHYGISYYNNDLPEINNNLEEYAMYAHEDFLVESWMQTANSQRIAALKASDIEATVNME